MYSWLWQHLPGPTALKAVQAALLFLLVVVVLFAWVFPKVVPLLPYNNVTVGAQHSPIPGGSGR